MMKKGKDKGNKKKLSVMVSFVAGLIIYLIGLFLLFGSSMSKVTLLEKVFNKMPLTTEVIFGMKITGLVMFLIGFVIFMISVILLYKNNDITENTRELIIEGQADVITIVVMTYVMIFMLVVCLLFDEVIGALLFGVSIIIQSVLNTILIKYFKGKK